MVAPIIAGSLIGGGASLIGGIMGNRANSAQNARNITFQREMAQNAHQYEVADLEAAGLNPILSATGGGGARASGGSSIAMQNPVKDMAASALQIASTNKLKAETKLTENASDINATQAEVEKIKLKILKEGIDIGKSNVSTAKSIGSKFSDAASGFSEFVGNTVNDSKATIRALRDLPSSIKRKNKPLPKNKAKREFEKFMKRRSR